MMRRLPAVLLILIAFPLALEAQDPAPSPATGSTLRVFVDNCPCSLD